MTSAEYSVSAVRPDGEWWEFLDSSAASAFLRGIAGGALKGRVLLTSRLPPGELEGLTGQRSVDLDSMDPEDAVVFFTHAINESPKDTELLRIRAILQMTQREFAK
ncbi:MAG: hypothetical protein IH962_07010, partial [Chloroflexi bacterium]|nr:hypothetical protein [Chloroflexota bacterium]